MPPDGRRMKRQWSAGGVRGLFGPGIRPAGLPGAGTPGSLRPARSHTSAGGKRSITAHTRFPDTSTLSFFAYPSLHVLCYVLWVLATV